MIRTDRVQTRVGLRIVLYEGEVYRLPRSCSGLRVRGGVAWVSFAGQDRVMGAGEEMRLDGGHDFAVVSTLGRGSLVLEVLERAPARSGSLIQPQLRRAAPCEGS